MKTKAVIVTILLLASNLVFGKKNAVQIIESYYSLGVSHINSGSGHGAGYSLNGSVFKGRKSLEAGLIYSERESKLAGADFKYKVMLGNFYKLQDVEKSFVPYLQYNLIYQKGLSSSPDVIKVGGETYSIPSEAGIISTLEHYLAYGNKIKLFGRTYMDTSLGLGLYQGSLDKINGPGTLGKHYGNYGFTYALKIGINYTFR